MPNGREYLPVTCSCGHALWFDLNAVRQAPYYDDRSEEQFNY